MCAVQVLFVNPYHRGSHRDFFEQWSAHSEHTFRLLSLSGHHWKWRMRHGAWTLAQTWRTSSRTSAPDVVVTTDMLDLALWKASVGPELCAVPHVQYFHENQLCYPDQHRREADLHFACTNIFSAALADEVWFNSRYHQDVFLDAARKLSNRLPGRELATAVSAARSHAKVHPPGVDVGLRKGSPTQRLRVLWVGRWEWDKGHDRFLKIAAMATAKCDIEFVILGATIDTDVGQRVRDELGGSLVFAGYVESRDEYERWAGSCDVVLSTARHEYFGLGVLEAALLGCAPLLPNALAYPEVFAGCQDAVFYDGVEDALHCLTRFADRRRRDGLQRPRGLERWRWNARARALDEALSRSVSELGR